MADEDGQEKTEEPSAQRREDARKQGQVAFSPDLVGSAVLFAGVVALSSQGPDMGRRLLETVRTSLLYPCPPELGVPEVFDLALGVLRLFAVLLVPFMVTLAVIGALAAMVQVGFHVTPERIEPDFDKINPASGFGKLFSVASLVKGGLALLKVAALGTLVYVVLRSRLGVFASVGTGDVETAAAQSWALVMRLALYLSGTFLVIGVVDFVYQRYRFEQSLKMSRQEVKEEQKREEGDPQLKGRRRQMAREQSRRRMLSEVPKATVVVTNPTHVAVALRYDAKTMRAPRVVAVGAGQLAERIKEAARNHAVPVVERPALARLLFRTAPVDRDIPGDLFAAVAEIIAFVYRLRARA